MRATIALILCLCALPARGQSLRGQWDIEMPNKQASVVLLIDADRRVTWDWRNENGQPGKTMLGYVARSDSREVEIPLTDKSQVIRLGCAVQSSERWLCHVYFLRERTTIDGLIATRVGPGPLTLVLQ